MLRTILTSLYGLLILAAALLPVVILLRDIARS